MSTPSTLTEAHFTALLRRARSAGIQVEISDSPDCVMLVVPSQRHITVNLRAGLAERYRMLCEALRQLRLAELIARDPWAAAVTRSMPVTTDATALDESADDSISISIDVCLETAADGRPTREVYLEPLAALRGTDAPLGDAIVDDCEATLRDATARISRETLDEHLSASAASQPRCELCGRAAYGTLGALALCRGHLYASVQGRLLPAEVLALRARHPDHPELGPVRYDAHGELRSPDLTR